MKLDKAVAFLLELLLFKPDCHSVFPIIYILTALLS